MSTETITGPETTQFTSERLGGRITFEIDRPIEPESWDSIDRALKSIEDSITVDSSEIFSGLVIKIGSGLTEGGGVAKAEENVVLLDYDKMKMSLQASEDYLVGIGEFNPGERTDILAELKDEPWSTLVYDLVHELGHIVDGKSPGEPYHRFAKEFSPTKYGRKADNEAFAEAFAYWVFGQQIDPKAAVAIENLVGGVQSNK